MEKHFVLSMGHNVIERTFLHGNWYAFACLFQHNRNKFFKKFHRYVPLSCIMHVATWDITLYTFLNKSNKNFFQDLA